MSFKDFLKNNGAPMQPEPIAADAEHIDEERQSEQAIASAISEDAERPDRLQEMQEKVTTLLAAVQKQDKNGQDRKMLLVEMTQKGNEIANIQQEQNKRIQQIEKLLATVSKRNEQKRKVIIRLLALTYITFCTCEAIAQQAFNISGFYGIWSFFKIFTGLKLLL